MTPAPRNDYEIWEDANLHFAAAETATLSRWIGVLVDAGETGLAIELDAELRAAISNGTEMGEAA